MNYKKHIILVIGIILVIVVLSRSYITQGSFISKFIRGGYYIPPPPYPLRFAVSEQSELLVRFIRGGYWIPPLPLPPLQSC